MLAHRLIRKQFKSKILLEYLIVSVSHLVRGVQEVEL